MKRSRNLRLVLMAATVPVVLGGCESEPTGQVLSSVEQCRSQETVSVEECEQAYLAARAEHERIAPRFESRVECDQQFENCVAVEEQGRTVYHPPMGGFLMGYLIGSALSPRGYYPVGGASPLYRDYRGGYYKPNGDFAGNRIGNVSGNKGKVALPARAVTVSRSGFGSSASARGGFGSSRGVGG